MLSSALQSVAAPPVEKLTRRGGESQGRNLRPPVTAGLAEEDHRARADYHS
jgi:hypothetical protein